MLNLSNTKYEFLLKVLAVIIFAHNNETKIHFKGYRDKPYLNNRF